MEDREQDEQPEDTAEPGEAVEPAESAPPAPGTGISASKLYRLRREVAEARRVINSTERPEPEQINEAAQAAEEARESLRGTSIAEEYLRLNPHRQSLVSEETLGSMRYAQQKMAGQFASTYGASSAIQSMVGALDAIARHPDSGTSRMLSQMGRASELVARMVPPESLSNLSAGVQSLASIYASHPAFTSGLSGMSRLLAESSLYTRRLINSEGTVGALQKMINETRADQQLARLYSEQHHDPTQGTVGALQQMVNEESARRSRLADLYEQMTSDSVTKDETLEDLDDDLVRRSEDLDDDLVRLSEDLSLDDLAGLTEYALRDAEFDTRASFYQRLEEAAPEDLDEFERIAKEVLEEEGLLEELEGGDSESPDITPRQALLALAVAQFPDITIGREERKRIDLYVQGTGVLFYAYIRVFQPGFYIFLATLLELLGLMSVLRIVNNRALDRVTEDEPDGDED
ncbi:hypothetical protein [Cellulomonas hominis]